MALDQIEDDLLSGEARSVRSFAALRLLEMDGYSRNDKRSGGTVPPPPVVIMIGSPGQSHEQAIPWLQHRAPAPALPEDTEKKK